ncbi:MAG TPA: hypothetical protein VHO25_04810, partial [Polyangiaceae bacterium]|nr:hypothetical protein [Polyangiaceae bacterium]
MAGEKTHIKIRIGAAMDASVAAVFKDVEKQAQRGAKAVDAANKRSSKEAEKEAQKQAKAAETAANREIRATEKALDAKIKAAERAIKASDKAAAAMARDNAKAEADIRREVEKTTRTREREAGKQARTEARAARERDRFAGRTSHRATRFFWPNAPIGSMATRAAGDLMRGAGVDLSLGGALQRNFTNQRLATELSTAGYLEGKGGPAGTRQDPRKLEAEARQLAISKGVSSESILEAQRSYTAIGGDLGTARTAMPDLIDLAIATQSNLNDVAVAAALAGEQLQNMSGKERLAAINGIMRSIAAQGKIGSIEMRDMAKELSKVAAAAGQFEGDVSQNMITLGGLMQIARKFGGATSAAMAGTGVTSFVNTFGKAARDKEFTGHGVKLRDSKGGLRDPIQIIMDSLVASKGNTLELSKMFMDERGKKMVTGLGNVYRRAGGADDPNKGLAAVRALLNANNPAALSQTNINADGAAYRAQGTTKSIQAQERWDAALLRMRDSLVGSMDKITPKLEEFARVLGDVATWVAENPKTAIGAAIGLSIGRAGLESAFRLGLEKVILGGGGLGGAFSGRRLPAGAFGGGAASAGMILPTGAGGWAATAGAALGIAFVAASAGALGKAMIDAFFAWKKGEEDKRFASGVSDANKLEEIRGLTRGRIGRGPVLPEEMDRDARAKKLAQELQAKWKRRIAEIDSDVKPVYDRAGRQTGTTTLTREQAAERDALV